MTLRTITTASEALEELRRVIDDVSRMGARSESGMIANENYPTLLALRDLEHFIAALAANEKTA